MNAKLKNVDILIALALILLAFAYRLLPHPQNVTPVAAAAIFAGAVLPAGLALTVPVLAMIASDILIGPHGLFWLTWTAFAATVFLGMWAGKKLGGFRVAAASVAGSTFYFVATNLGVFLFENMYPRTWAGLAECFEMALPFYRNTVLGDLIFCGALFGIYALASSRRTAASAARP